MSRNLQTIFQHGYTSEPWYFNWTLCNWWAVWCILCTNVTTGLDTLQAKPHISLHIHQFWWPGQILLFLQISKIKALAELNVYKIQPSFTVLRKSLLFSDHPKKTICKVWLICFLFYFLLYRLNYLVKAQRCFSFYKWCFTF